MNGSITISDGRIMVTTFGSDPGRFELIAIYETVTIEDLASASRILAMALNVPSEDRATECRRIHTRDQQQAMVREAIERIEGEYE